MYLLFYFQQLALLTRDSFFIIYYFVHKSIAMVKNYKKYFIIDINNGDNSHKNF